jgi:quercetin dioxygenase-like cupin family protein
MAKPSTDDILLNSESLPWIPMGGPGLWFRHLRSSSETGIWTVLIKLDKGASFAPHKHLGAAEFYVLKGSLKYRPGVAREGYYGYEPLGVIHRATAAEDETILFYVGYGAVAFIGTDTEVVGVLDWEWIQNAVEEHAKSANSAKPAA